jgi:DNA transformation protein and related proteins
MAVTDEFLQYVLGQLSALGGLGTRRMFGAVGLYCDGAFFGLIAGDVLYFKVGESNRADYEARGMSRFRPFPDRSPVSMGYYELPADVLEDQDECVLWAQRSAIVARSAGKGRPNRPPASNRRTRAGTRR